MASRLGSGFGVLNIFDEYEREERVLLTDKNQLRWRIFLFLRACEQEIKTSVTEGVDIFYLLATPNVETLRVY